MISERLRSTVHVLVRVHGTPDGAPEQFTCEKESQSILRKVGTYPEILRWMHSPPGSPKLQDLLVISLCRDELLRSKPIQMLKEGT